MTQRPVDTFSTRAAGTALARLGASHGYRFVDDTVQLKAMFTVVNPAADQCSWALQLWAASAAPANADSIKGHLVAEAELPAIGEIADEHEGIELSAFALPPAGTAAHVMVLALVSGRRGQFDQVHDFAVYPNLEQFIQPRLAGRVAFQINGDRVQIEAERVENPRAADNVTGTLSLELWAMPAPYQGGAFAGVSLAGVAFDPVTAGVPAENLSFDLPYTPPPAGTWNYVLMLREWTAAGYATRDFTNFTTLVTVADTKPQTPVAEAPVKPSKSAPAKPVRGAVIIPPFSIEEVPQEMPQPVSVNQASLHDLDQIPGLPTKVAEAIIAGRPYKSLDELVRVKGMGAKLLARLRDRLKL